jgi:hypothetical protein
MKGNKLIVLFGVFILAVVIHTIYFGREYFTASQTPARTPLTKENVQALVDEFVLDYYAVYQKFQDMKSADPRIVYRLKAIGSDLNMINDQYPMVTFAIKNIKFTDYPGISLEDLKIVKDYFSYRIGTGFMASPLKPAELIDLDQFSNRTRSFVSFVTDKATLARIQLPADFQQTSQAVLQNVVKLKQNLINMKEEEIPVLKADLYWFVNAMARNNFIQEPQLKDAPIPVVNTVNLPLAKTSLQALAAAVMPAVAAPPVQAPVVAGPLAESTATTVTVSSAAPVGYKFSELVEMLLTFSPTRHAERATQRQEKQLTSTAADLLNTQYAAGTAGASAMTSNAFMEQIRGVVRDELKGLKEGPKDAANKDLVNRATEVVKNGSCGPTKQTTNSLEQGKWFRTATDAKCPYANGQQMASESEPVPPFNMNDYIRKDSIPCWACNLK